MLIGLIGYAGPAQLLRQMRALAPLVPVLLVLTGIRYFLQAAGWRLAMVPEDRPSSAACFNAVLIGEALGYVAWGPIVREPAKALLLGPRVPPGAGLAAALVERAVFVLAATGLAVAAAALLAWQRWSLGTPVAAAVLGVTVVAAWGIRRLRRVSSLDGAVSSADPGARGRPEQVRRAHRVPALVRVLLYRRPGVLLAIGGLAVAQEAVNVLEAYLIFAWLGAGPTVTVAVVFEGLSRFVNAAGQFVPGRLGVYEAASAFLADALALAGGVGVSLALARRFRSLVWAAPGGVLLGCRGYRRWLREADVVARACGGAPSV